MAATGMNKIGGGVPLMWCVALCSGLAALSYGWVELERNPSTLIIKKVLEHFSSLLNVVVGYLCV